MKRIFIILGLLTIFIAGCEIHPYADFIVDRKYVQPYDLIMFTNLSERGSSYNWDFGDGTITNIPNPTHAYTSEGIYTVTLTVTSRDGNRDIATLEIEVFYTELEITVTEWNTSYIVPGAFVLLYETLDDWYDDYNAVSYGYADVHGVISFIGLESRRYYVWAEADNIVEPGDHYDNYQFYLDNLIEYISTPILSYADYNPWIAWVDYYPAYKSTFAKNRRIKYDLNKIKRKGNSYMPLDASKESGL
jgi:hypothetical protein